ncbi:MAG: hypothetical protein SchgKO_08640 [Schleiferiaceae bacterium]
MVEILIPIAGMALVFGIVYFGVTTKHKEKMEMIERGVDPQVLESPRGYGALKFGPLLIGLGLGFFLYKILPFDGEMMRNGLLLIFGGIGLVIGHTLARKQMDEDQDKRDRKALEREKMMRETASHNTPPMAEEVKDSPSAE